MTEIGTGAQLHPFPYCLYSAEQNRKYNREAQKSRRQGKKFAFRLACDSAVERHYHPSIEQLAYLLDMRFIEEIDGQRGIYGYRADRLDRDGNPSTPGIVSRVNRSPIPKGWEPIARWPMFQEDGQGGKTLMPVSVPSTQRFGITTMQIKHGNVHFPLTPYLGNPELCDTPFLASEACRYKRLESIGVHFCAKPKEHSGSCVCICGECRKENHGHPFCSMRRVGDGWRVDMFGTLELPRGAGSLKMDHSVFLSRKQALRRIANIICEYRTTQPGGVNSSNPITVEYGPIAHVIGEHLIEKAERGGDSGARHSWQDKASAEDAKDFGQQNELGRAIPRSVDDDVFTRGEAEILRQEVGRLVAEADALEVVGNGKAAKELRLRAKKFKTIIDRGTSRNGSRAFTEGNDFKKANKRIRESIVEMQDLLSGGPDEGRRTLARYIENFIRPRGILSDTKSTWLIYDGRDVRFFTPETAHRLHIAADWHSEVAFVPRRRWPICLPATLLDELAYDHYKEWDPPRRGELPYAPWSFSIWSRSRRYDGQEQGRQHRRLSPGESWVAQRLNKGVRDQLKRFRVQMDAMQERKEHPDQGLKATHSSKRKTIVDMTRTNAECRELARKYLVGELSTARHHRRKVMLRLALAAMRKSTSKLSVSTIGVEETFPLSNLAGNRAGSSCPDGPAQPFFSGEVGN